MAQYDRFKGDVHNLGDDVERGTQDIEKTGQHVFDMLTDIIGFNEAHRNRSWAKIFALAALLAMVAYLVHEDHEHNKDLEKIIKIQNNHSLLLQSIHDAVWSLAPVTRDIDERDPGAKGKRNHVPPPPHQISVASMVAAVQSQLDTSKSCAVTNAITLGCMAHDTCTGLDTDEICTFTNSYR